MQSPPRWTTLPVEQRHQAVATIRATCASVDADVATAIEAAIAHLLVRRRGTTSTKPSPTHRLTHQLSLGGEHAAAAVIEIGAAVYQAGTIVGAAPILGVTVRTIHRWQRQYPALAAAIRQAVSA